MSVPQGPALFRAWIERAKLSYTDAADYLGLDKSIVTKLANGTRSAGLWTAVMIERRTGVPAETWLSENADSRELVTSGNGRNRKQDK